MKNYSLETEKTEQGLLYRYSDGYSQLVRQITSLYDKEGNLLGNFTRARYLGKGIFLTFTHPNIIGIVNVEEKSIQQIRIEESISSYTIKDKGMYLGEELIERLTIKGITGLHLNLSYIEQGTPVKHSDLMNDSIWKISKVSSFNI